MPFEEVKQRQSGMWGSGPFENVARSIADVHDELVGQLEPRPGERFLDVATGTGEVAFRAAQAGAEVTGVDFAPPLVETAKRLAREQGLAIGFEVGDAEDLAFLEASFDVVASCFGCMFGPDQRAVARELARVCRPGGRLGLATWDPDGEIGEFFRIVMRFAPPPPPEAGNPLDWGRREHVRALLEDDFELEFSDGTSPLVAESGEAVWDIFSTSFGPVKVLAESLDDDRRDEFRRAFVDLHERGRVGDEIRMDRRYKLILGTRR